MNKVQQSGNMVNGQSSQSHGSSKSSILKTALLAAGIALSSPAFSQLNPGATIASKDLDKQYSLVMKDLKKDDANIQKAASTYDVKEKKVLATIEPEVEYVIKTLIPTIYEDHLSIKKNLRSGLNKEQLLKLVFLLKGDVVWKFSEELGKRVWSFETTNKYSDEVKYPVYVIDNFIGHYAKGQSAKTQLKIIEEVFQKPLEDIDSQFQQGKVTVTFPLVAMYNKHFDEWTKVTDGSKRPMTKYIVGQPTKNADGSIDVTFDINKFIDEEMEAKKMTDKSNITTRICQEMMFIAGINAFVEQYSLYIDEGSEDIQKN